MKLKFSLIHVFMVLMLLGHTNAHAGRIYGGFYTAEKIANVRSNCNRYDWAAKQRDRFIAQAKYWLAKDDETLWAMVPGQDLPRCIDVTFDRLTEGPKFLGCLKCGHNISKYGNYPYNPEFEQKPWKLTCPSCGTVFPTNDFGKYYKSAIDEHGLFNPASGDKSLLYNLEHPDPKDPLHKYGVDDGFGYVNENGRSYRFIGYYTWKYWDHINAGLNALANAFLYTGDQRYAHKAAILLDRIADVYPDMDWAPYSKKGWYHSDGGTNRGKIEGAIWETGTVQGFADAYDKILSGTVNDASLYSFLKKQSLKYKLPGAKGTRDLFVKNVDDGILRTAFKGVLSKQIWGNQGMHQLTVARCAVALNTAPETTEWLDWLFTHDGGNIPGLMIRNLDRDGTTDEGAPGYTYMWGNLIAKLGVLLADYKSYTKHDIFAEYPQFNATFMAAYRMSVLGISIPNIGDAGATGTVTNSYIDPNFIALGYFYTRDPQMAIAAYRANGNSVKGLGMDIYSKDPESLSREIKSVAEKNPANDGRGGLMSGFGLASLEIGKGTSGIALASNFGRSIKHAHPDMLNFDLLAYGNWLAPDHGYPEYATKWPSNNEWTGSTLSHNLVFVNGLPQKEVWGGHTRMFKQLKGFGAFELDGKKAYPDVKEYSRTMLLIEGPDTGNAYAIDIFRVLGGHDHLYSFHGPPGTISTEGLKLKPQQGGTYAGTEVAKGTLAKGFPIGYSHLYNVKRDTIPPPQFMLDWKVEDGYRNVKATDHLHLRMYALNQVDDVALADGDPPQNKTGNPKTLGYVLMHRAAPALNSNFVNLIEPYKQNPFIKSVKRLDEGKNMQVSLKIEHVNGEIDYILYNPDSTQTMQTADGLKMDGTLGYVRQKGGKPVEGILLNGKRLSYANMNLIAAGPIRGKVVKMNRELKGGGWLLVDQQLPVDGSLNGSQLMVSTEGKRDACYSIVGIERQGNLTRVYCGPITFVNDYKGENYKEGLMYDFEEGAAFTITSHKIWKQKI
ncbi:heparinase II/III domain-containing protein [Pedobacter heparinus]|uniref:Heparinase II/III family protein n=1 Tax=Pedobacter heparinus (strain ATCC 13125 / DSM 2366 / CIP 104194 / JCM 7457 / NBRC 12017 / NCIMB 9290 / NRRL B-14731 / HIM 762-3) TaxID=485917 RepID=C6XZ73_PEDHD|nr:heparinase II/III family protein [Pedobacter heparinus]ACU02555.1 Heparinase II/III family protein [Pedobacter heparinus DSM 2366]